MRKTSIAKRIVLVLMTIVMTLENIPTELFAMETPAHDELIITETGASEGYEDPGKENSPELIINEGEQQKQDPGSNTNTDTNTNTETDANTNTETDANTNTDSNTDTGTENSSDDNTDSDLTDQEEINETENTEAENFETQNFETQNTEAENTETENTETKSEKTESEETGNVKPDFEVHAFSLTDNIIGDVFANMFEKMQERSESEEEEGAAVDNLDEYPVEHRELSEYEGSLRLRYLSEEDAEDPSYLVYRDSFLIIPHEEGDSYTVEMSEDRRLAIVTPAIPEEQLIDKTGIIFLKDSVGEDIILVFDGEPEYQEYTIDDDGSENQEVTHQMICHLQDVSDITINQLFSDGHISMEAENVEDAETETIPAGRRMLKAAPKKGGKGGSSISGDWDYETSPKGTNWEGEIDNFSAGGPDFDIDFDIWDLDFAFHIAFWVDYDYNITTSGSTNGRDKVKIAQAEASYQVFSMSLDYCLETEFDEHPINVKGNINSKIDVDINLIAGTKINNDDSKITITDFTLQNPDDVNKDIQFYIGTGVYFDRKLGEVKINLIFTKIKFGPIFKVTANTENGYYYTARVEKDTFDPGSPADDDIHLCARMGDPGCLDITGRKVFKQEYYAKIDLYFDDWRYDFTDSGEKAESAMEYYDSYTFDTGIKEGRCPYHIYRVPVFVWEDENMAKGIPNITVTVSEEDMAGIEEPFRIFTTAITGEGGEANLYLPYKENYKYKITASGRYEDTDYTKQTDQPSEMQRGVNDQINIFLKDIDPNMQTIRIEKIWDIDPEGHDHPESVYAVLQYYYLNQWNTVGDKVELKPDPLNDNR
ncbi:MAG: hypothetical protein IJ821_01320 [Lachnospiraceae bacterium]|nr:hypothetical protein [Lachnospiraceae bacterium]